MVSRWRLHPHHPCSHLARYKFTDLRIHRFTGSGFRISGFTFRVSDLRILDSHPRISSVGLTFLLEINVHVLFYHIHPP